MGPGSGARPAGSAEMPTHSRQRPAAPAAPPCLALTERTPWGPSAAAVPDQCWTWEGRAALCLCFSHCGRSFNKAYSFDGQEGCRRPSLTTKSCLGFRFRVLSRLRIFTTSTQRGWSRTDQGQAAGIVRCEKDLSVCQRFSAASRQHGVPSFSLGSAHLTTF